MVVATQSSIRKAFDPHQLQINPEVIHQPDDHQTHTALPQPDRKWFTEKPTVEAEASADEEEEKRTQ